MGIPIPGKDGVNIETGSRWLTDCLSIHLEQFLGVILTLNVRGLSYLGLTRSISSLRRQDISSHDIDYVEYVSPGLTRGRILSTCVISMWGNDMKCKYMFMFPLKNLACKGLRMHGMIGVKFGMLMYPDHLQCHQTTSHNLHQCWPSSMMQYCITRPQWFNVPDNFTQILLGYSNGTREIIWLSQC